jgi:hypothetical protein
MGETPAWSVGSAQVVHGIHGIFDLKINTISENSFTGLSVTDPKIDYHLIALSYLICRALFGDQNLFLGLKLLIFVTGIDSITFFGGGKKGPSPGS